MVSWKTTVHACTRVPSLWCYLMKTAFSLLLPDKWHCKTSLGTRKIQHTHANSLFLWFLMNCGMTDVIYWRQQCCCGFFFNEYCALGICLEDIVFPIVFSGYSKFGSLRDPALIYQWQHHNGILLMANIILLVVTSNEYISHEARGDPNGRDLQKYVL